MKDTSRTDRQILEYMSEGCTQAQIAKLLTEAGDKLSHEGVRMRIFKMCEKFGADNSYHLLAISFRRGILK